MERKLPSSSSHTVLVRPQNAVVPMTLVDRLKMQVKNMFTKSTDPDDGNEDDAVANGSIRSIQYRLETHRKEASAGIFKKFFNTCCLARSVNKRNLILGIHPNKMLAIFMHWMFRVNFIFLFCFMWLLFIAFVIIFAGFITIAGRADPQCVRIGGKDFAMAGTPFMDSFALSWTTFTTLGYGSTYTALSHENTNQYKCFWVNFVCSLESLIGVLYSGFCGAILFGKILRIQSTAQVMFSDPLLIQYGAGLSSEYEATAGDSSGDDRSPCPVLIFRIVNKLYGDVGGEIMDATLNVVASVGIGESDPFSLDSNHSSNTKSDSNPSNGDNPVSDDPTDSPTRNTYLLNRFREEGKTVTRQEMLKKNDEDTNITNKHMFSKMQVEPSDHPFFKRVWLVKHVLDQDSPILKPRVRQQIRRNRGHWPQKLNNYDSIRDSLQFNQILVSLNGLSNVSASDVYAQRIYDFVDLNIGYQFVNILYRGDDGALGVDVDLINDVREQTGGGGEPLILDL